MKNDTKDTNQQNSNPNKLTSKRVIRNLINKY